MTMRSTGSAPLWMALAVLCTLPGVAAAQCDISGPTEVSTNRTFTLCGPTGYTYEWYGPGVPNNNRTRCITVSGRERGTYEYLLVVKQDGQEVERCRSVVNVGGATGGVSSCSITGPTRIDAGGSAELCATGASLHSFSWSGPNGYSSTSRCISATQEGTYTLTTRNPITGSSRTCTHYLDVVGGSSSNADCAISGAEVISSGQTARLCGPSYSNAAYQWRGPSNFSAASRCISVSRVGTYTLTIRNRSTGATITCSHEVSLDSDYGDDDADQVVGTNCPRNLAFWRQQCSQGTRTGNPRMLSDAELRLVAARMDVMSNYFNWSNDLTGICQALSPGSPLTQRKRAAREYAVLLANVAAGEHNVTTNDGTYVGLDQDTEVNYRTANTIGEVIGLADRMLSSGRGNFASLYQTLNNINNGRNIGPTCN